MTSFEVDDRFAGKKGPCPKCGHIIEIPKEKLVIHAPDVITDGKKQRKPLGQDARPILQKRFIYTGKQVFWGIMGSLGAIAAAYLVGALTTPFVSQLLGAIAVFLIAFPLAEFGYMLIRDDNDLEMFLGNERHIRSLKVAIVFGLSWLGYETLVHFLNATGPISCLYLLVMAAIGAIGALVFFDCNYGKALLVYFLFAFGAIVMRGLMLAPTNSAWIWQNQGAGGVQTAPVANVGQTRMNGMRTGGATDEEIVDAKMAIKEQKAQNKAKQKAKAAAKSNDNQENANAESEDEEQTPKRSRMRRRR